MADRIITVTDPSVVTNDTLSGYNNYSDIDGQLGTTMTPTEATNGKTVTLSDGVVHEVTTKPVGTTNGEFTAVISNAVTVDLSGGGSSLIENATDDGLDYDASALITSAAYSVDMSSDGLEMYFSGDLSGKILTLSTAFSPAGAANVPSRAGLSEPLQQIQVLNSGNDVFGIVPTYFIKREDLTTPYDFSAGNINGANNFYSAGGDWAPDYGSTQTIRGFRIRPTDGAFMMLSLTDLTISSIPLATPWNPASYTIASRVTIDLSSVITYMGCFAVNSDGTNILVEDGTTKTIYQFELGTGWDLNTLNIVPTSSLTVVYAIADINYTDSDAKFITVDTTGNIKSYTF